MKVAVITAIINDVINNNELEGLKLNDWIEHHKSLGFDSFYVINLIKENEIPKDINLENVYLINVVVNCDFYDYNATSGNITLFNENYFTYINKLIDDFKKTSSIDWFIVLDINQYIQSSKNIHRIIAEDIMESNNGMIVWKNNYSDGKLITKLQNKVLKENELSFFNTLIKVEEFTAISNYRFLPQTDLCRGPNKLYTLKQLDNIYIDNYKFNDLYDYLNFPLWYLYVANYSKPFYYGNIIYIYYIYHNMNAENLNVFISKFHLHVDPKVIKYLKYHLKNKFWVD